METTKKIIWSNDVDTIEAIEKDLLEHKGEDGYYFDIDETNSWACACETNDAYLSDEIANLDKELGQSIVIIATLGLWNGTRKGWKHLNGTNLNDIFSETCGDYVTWYVENGDIHCTDIHHDGTNHYIYRAIKEGISDWEFDEEMANGTDIDKLTDKLGHYVSEIYGWRDAE